MCSSSHIRLLILTIVQCALFRHGIAASPPWHHPNVWYSERPNRNGVPFDTWNIGIFPWGAVVQDWDFDPDDDDDRMNITAGGMTSIYWFNGVPVNYRSAAERLYQYNYVGADCGFSGFINDIVPKPKPHFTFATMLWSRGEYFNMQNIPEWKVKEVFYNRLRNRSTDITFDSGHRYPYRRRNKRDYMTEFKILPSDFQFLASTDLGMWTDKSWKCIRYTELLKLGYDHDKTPRWFDEDYDDSLWPNAIELWDYSFHFGNNDESKGKAYQETCLGGNSNSGKNIFFWASNSFIKLVDPRAKIIWHNDLAKYLYENYFKEGDRLPEAKKEEIWNASRANRGLNQAVCKGHIKYCHMCRRKYFNHCVSNPCEHGATCENTNNWLAIACNCAPGYTGTLCETDINECESRPCGKWASKCIDLINAFECICHAGFIGITCDKNRDECEPKPCKNGATCVDGVNKVTCECVPGYEGDKCGKERDECESFPCRNGGTCSDHLNKYQCGCIKEDGESAYEGDNCENCTLQTEEECRKALGGCESDPCQNNGHCQKDKYDKKVYTCSCAGFTGEHCESPLDECKSKPCSNNATCKDELKMYTCDCPSGFTGTHCEIKAIVCLSAPCKNNGICNDADKTDYYECDCAEGFTGANCETPLDPCISNPCDHNATCLAVDNNEEFKCECHDGYSGEECEIVSPCVSEPCPKDFDCVTNFTAFEYKCVRQLCFPGRFGDECALLCHCKSDAPCDKETGRCPEGCAKGYSGPTCSDETSRIFAGLDDDMSITMLVMAVAFLAALIALIVVLVLRRRRKKPTESEMELQTVSDSDLSGSDLDSESASGSESSTDD